MSPSSLPPLLLLLLLLAASAALASNSTIEWPLSSSSSSSAMKMFLDSEDNDNTGSILDVDDDGEKRRSMLYWGRVTYYISYAALAANRIPCPARSGRSYYTHNCYKASGPVRPYYRGCAAITRCRR